MQPMDKTGYSDIVTQYSNSYRLYKENRKLYKKIDGDIGIEHLYDIHSEIRDAMSRYDTRSSFTRSERYYNRMANRYGISWLGRPIAPTTPVYSIYRWLFSDKQHVYIGLTKDIKQRISAELRRGTVYEYLKNTKQRFSISILESGLYPSDAAEMERYYIVQERLDGHIPINKAIGGTIGGCHSRSDDELLEMASQYKSVMELRGNGALLKALKTRPGLYRKATASMIKKPHPTFERQDIEPLINGCTTLREFMKSHPSEYCVCKRNGWEDLLGRLKRTYVQSKEVSEEAIRKAVSECKSRLEFNKRYRRETYVAKKLGIYDDVVKHLPKQSGKLKGIR